ncbi:MAG: hypothetical protein DHS20C14_21280 [Phycisphaeraceae bacterium]|nr:MAG: hypothetical protein DHS20C14_21280 [Phycisphaeraceae bacterium]
MRRFVSFGPGFVVLLACVVSLLVVPKILRIHSAETTRAQITLARYTIDDDDILARIDRAVTAVADSVAPTVVHIETDGRRSRGSSSSGAGWVFDDAGHVVTNAHVVRQARDISVEFYDGRVCEATLVGTDPFTDIAVLELECAGPFFPVPRAEGRVVRQGERVFAFGSPFGFKFSMSEGIVSGLGREPPTGGFQGGFTNYIQTDAAVNPGNSGGPLVDVQGELIGMNVAIATARSPGGSPDEDGTGDSAGISFAIPLGTIEPIVNQILTHGNVERGFLGISFGNRADDNDNAVRRFVSDEGRLVSGIQVFGVTEDGPSEAAGIETGDIIVGIEGYPVLGISALRTLISSTRPGEDLSVSIFRSGEIEDRTVTLARMPEETYVDVFSQRVMIELGVLFTDVEAGVLVRRVFEGPGGSAGLEAGQIVQRVEGQAVGSRQEFLSRLLDLRLLEGRPVDIEVRTGQGDDAEVAEITLRLGR